MGPQPIQPVYSQIFGTPYLTMDTILDVVCITIADNVFNARKLKLFCTTKQILLFLSRFIVFVEFPFGKTPMIYRTSVILYFQTSNFYIFIFQDEKICERKVDLVYIKTHKTGSCTVTNMLYRFEPTPLLTFTQMKTNFSDLNFQKH